MTITLANIQDILELRGADLGASDWMEVTQHRVDQFAEATGDHQWIHVDTERARSGPFGGTIAHGYLTVALIVPLLSELLEFRQAGMTLNYGLNKLRFPAPVLVGSRIRLSGRVADVTETNGGAEITLDLVVEIEGDTKPACVARAVYRHLA
jgi:acyl dehydratase